MQSPMRSWPSLVLMLAVGAIACTTPTTKINLGPEFFDKARDLAGSQKRLAEFDVVCVAPTRLKPPKVAMAPAWCAWTMDADRVIRANNALVPNRPEPGGSNGED